MSMEMPIRFRAQPWPVIYGSIDSKEPGRLPAWDTSSRRWKRARRAYNAARRSTRWRGICCWDRHVEASRGRPLRGGLDA